jgi:hypothetical protein
VASRPKVNFLPQAASVPEITDLYGIPVNITLFPACGVCRLEVRYLVTIIQVPSANFSCDRLDPLVLYTVHT